MQFYNSTYGIPPNLQKITNQNLHHCEKVEKNEFIWLVIYIYIYISQQKLLILDTFQYKLKVFQQGLPQIS